MGYKYGKEQLRANHAKKMDDLENQYMGKIQEKWGESLFDEKDTTVGEAGSKTGFSEGVLKQLALLPIERAKKRADEKRQALSNNLSLKKLEEELNKIGKEFKEEAFIMASIMRKYFDELTQYKNHGKIDGEIIERMRKSAVNIGKLADALILTQNGNMKELRTALKFSLGVMQLTDDNFEEAKKGIIKAFKKGGNWKSFGWMAVTFMDQEHKLKFAKEYASTLKGEKEVKNFIREASAAGSLNFLEIEEVIGEGKYGSLFSEQERNSHAVVYKKQHDFSKSFKRRMKASWGAYNQTGSLLNFKNVFLSLVVGGGYFSAGFSTALDLWKGGKFKSAEGIASAFVNVQNGIKVGAAVAATKAMKRNLEETDLNNRTEMPEAVKEANSDIKSNLTPGLHAFFKADDYKGASAFGDWSRYAFTKYKGDALTKYLTLNNFRKWMYEHNEANKYAKVIAQFEDVKQGNKNITKIKNTNTSDHDIEVLAVAFKTLNIGGDTAKSQYTKTIKTIKTVV